MYTHTQYAAKHITTTIPIIYVGVGVCVFVSHFLNCLAVIHSLASVSFQSMWFLSVSTIYICKRRDSIRRLLKSDHQPNTFHYAFYCFFIYLIFFCILGRIRHQQTVAHVWSDQFLLIDNFSLTIVVVSHFFSFFCFWRNICSWSFGCWTIYSNHIWLHS